MLLRMDQVVLGVDEPAKRLRAVAAKRLGVEEDALLSLRILRRSLDARARRRSPVFVYSLRVEVAWDGTESLPWQVRPFEEIPSLLWSQRQSAGGHRPVVVGAGPAGLFAALVLAEAGRRPVLLERGAPIAERRRTVGAFWGKGILDEESNVLFGEGGAGAFSDGKLTSRSKDHRRKDWVLQQLIHAGAHESIGYDAEAHLGSDVLAEVVRRLRERIESLGGEVRFSSRVDGLAAEQGAVRGVLLADGEVVETEVCILATGHSARDVYRWLRGCGVQMVPKAFAAGVRIEVPQKVVDRAQYGRFAGHPHLGAASFRLTEKGADGRRNCYTFCMCPGGRIIGCANEAGTLAANGMSLSARGSDYANAAFLVPVDPVRDCGAAEDALAGLAWQRSIERRAFTAGGADYALPATWLDCFPEQPMRSLCGSPTRMRGADFSQILPDELIATLVDAAPRMLRRLGGLAPEQALIAGVETRSSSPVRILRGEDRQALGCVGVFPCGEGAGMAGGIISSAIDGMASAEAALTVL